MREEKSLFYLVFCFFFRIAAYRESGLDKAKNVVYDILRL
jgi:hypothetical protein